MPVDCQRSTSGGKGNFGMFIERYPNICAAGIPTAQPGEHMKGYLQHYLLKDETDALLGDTIFPEPKPRPLPPLRHPIPLDMRNATRGQAAMLINPPVKTKFQVLVDDLKETPYASYWKKSLGSVSDPTPMLPAGFDKHGTVFGKPTAFHGRLYDIVMPKILYPDKTPPSKLAGAQTQRNYCTPAFNSDLTLGHRTYVDKRGSYAKCCLTNDRIVIGTAGRIIVNSTQANIQEQNQPMLGSALTPNNNISQVPDGFTFGKLKPPDNLPECLTTCDLNKDVEFLRKCLKHLNTLRKFLSKRFLPTFFHNFYLNLKNYDQDRSGWLNKNVVYRQCAIKLIRFDPALIEPLLSMWEAYDGSKIKYKVFVRVLNYRIPSPEIPKIMDVPKDCIDFRTTYTEMVKPGQEVDTSFMAGVPSGKYFDRDYPITPENYCRADNTCLPQESDMKSCISPSVMTLLNVTHRDMYGKREPHVVRRVFVAAGEQFTDETFNTVWEEAKKYHSEGWVCYETFRKALKVIEDRSKSKKD